MPNAVNRIDSAPALSVGGDLVHILVDSRCTGGASVLVHVVCAPGSGPPMHTHAREDELFYVIEGEMTFVLEGQETRGGPGTSVFARRGAPHRFVNRSSSPARFIVAITPGGLDEFFREVGTPLPPGTMQPVSPTPGEIEALVHGAPNYGITLHIP